MMCFISSYTEGKRILVWGILDPVRTSAYLEEIWKLMPSLAGLLVLPLLPPQYSFRKSLYLFCASST